MTTTQHANDEANALTKRRVTAETNAARQKALTGKSPQRRYLEKVLIALTWVHLWGWASSETLRLLLGTVGGRSFGKKLVQARWLRREPIRIISQYHVVASDVLTITTIGVAELVALAGDKKVTEIATAKRPSKVQLVHDSFAQRLTLLYTHTECPMEFIERWGAINKYEPAHQLGLAERGVKKPDVVWTTDAGWVIDVEVELSGKWARELDQFISNHIWRQSEEGPSHHLMVFFASRATLDRYRRAMQPGTRVRLWFWSEQSRRWEAGLDDIEHHWVTIPDDFTFEPLLLPDSAR